MSKEKLPECDPQVFKKGKPLLAADTWRLAGSKPAEGSLLENGDILLEEWTKKISKESGQKIDWHYSGGRASVLYVGDLAKIKKAIEENPCPVWVMRWFNDGDTGLYRKDVTPVPKGTIAGFYDGGSGSTFIVEEKPK